MPWWRHPKLTRECISSSSISVKMYNINVSNCLCKGSMSGQFGRENEGVWKKGTEFVEENGWCMDTFEGWWTRQDRWVELKAWQRWEVWEWVSLKPMVWVAQWLGVHCYKRCQRSGGEIFPGSFGSREKALGSGRAGGALGSISSWVKELAGLPAGRRGQGSLLLESKRKHCPKWPMPLRLSTVKWGVGCGGRLRVEIISKLLPVATSRIVALERV